MGKVICIVQQDTKKLNKKNQSLSLIEENFFNTIMYGAPTIRNNNNEVLKISNRQDIKRTRNLVHKLKYASTCVPLKLQ